VAILVPAEADVTHGHAGVPRELRGDPAGVRVALLDFEQRMCTFSVRRKAELFHDLEILRPGPDAARRRRSAVRARHRVER
jgi:hypothetical protein